jgi:sulfur carrier protein ThiS
MRVFVDGREVYLRPGMKVRHALIQLGLEPWKGELILRDRWGNPVGLDGALRDGDELFLHGKPTEKLSQEDRTR